MSILSILNELADTTLLNKKRSILKREKDNNTLKRVFLFTLSPDINFYIRKRPDFTPGVPGQPFMSLDMALNLMKDRITTRYITGNEAVDYYKGLLENMHPEDAEVLCRVVERNLKVGVSTALVNDNWPKLVPTYTWMKAVTDPKDLEFPAIAQTKLDGMRVYISWGDYSLIIRSTGGNVLDIWDVLDDDANTFIETGETWDGELICYDPKTNKPLPRKVSNGILTKASRGTISKEEAEMIRFVAWDIVDKTQKIPYSERLLDIEKRFEVAGSFGKFVLIDSQYVSDMDEVQELFEKKLEEGEEGIMVKNLSSVWEPKRSKYHCKFKAEKTADLLVIDWNEGNGKYEGKVGSLVCITSDEKVIVNVSGLKDWQRNPDYADDLKGTIIEVLYNQKITKKGVGLDSLYLPRFSRERPDKIEANSSEEL